MTIAVVGCDPCAPGGISRVIRLTLDSPLSHRWKLLPVPTWVEGSRPRRALAYLMALTHVWSLAASGRLQAVHLHMAARGSFWRKWMLSLPLPWMGVRVIVHIHDGTLPEWVTTRRRLTRDRLHTFLEKADAVVSLSPYWVNVLKPLAPAAHWAVIRNPVDIPAGLVSRPSAGDEACAPSEDHRAGDGKVILFLGRLRAEKGLDDILSAALSMQHDRPDDRWHLAGDGDLPAVKQRLSDCGLSTSVCLLGWLDERQKATALAAADLLVLPSHAEGQPLAVLEAMAWGIPVVASGVGDIPDLLATGAGLVVPKGNVQELVKAIRWILEHPDQAREMGIRGRSHVLQHHSIERMSCELDALYRRMGLIAMDDPLLGTARATV